MKRCNRSNLAAAAFATAMVMAVSACAADDKAVDAPVGENVATGDAFTIGAMAPEGGATAWPDISAGIDAGVWYVNNQMGGVGGRELVVDVCAGDGSPETAVSCANKFVGEDYPVVFDGYDSSFGGARPILVEAGIPYVGTVSGDPANEAVASPDAFYFTGPLAVTAAGTAAMWKALGTTSAHLLAPDAPSAHTYVDLAMRPLADAAGVELNVQYADPAKANYSAIAAAEVDGDPDMVGALALPEEGCTSLFAALRSQGWEGDIFVGSCTQYVEELSAAEAAGTITVPRLWLPQARDNAPAEVQEQLDDFTEAMKAVDEEDMIGARAVYAFAGVVTLAQSLGDVDGEITAGAVKDALGSIKDQKMFLGPQMTCDGKQWPNSPSACSNQSIFFTVQEDGSYAPGVSGGFTTIDQSLIGG